MVRPGVWQTLLAQPVLTAVMADWRYLLGADYEWFKGYLSPTNTRGLSYPCLAVVDCGCRHVIVSVNGSGLRAICQCRVGDCQALELTGDEAELHRFAVDRFVVDVVGALRFGAPKSGPGLYAGPQVRLVGTYLGAPVYLALCVSETELVAGLNQMACGYGGPFILLGPTAGLRSSTVDQMLAGLGGIYIPLAACLGGNGAGGLRLRCSIDEVLAKFRPRAARNGDSEDESATRKKSGECGRLRWENYFREIRLGGVLYNLHARKKARYCLQYLVDKGAYDESSARHLEEEIDPYVRKHAKMSSLPDSSKDNLRIQHYFTGTGKDLQQLCAELIKSAGNGRFYLHTK